MSFDILPPAILPVPTTGPEFLAECKRLSARITEVEADMQALRTQVQAVLERWDDGEKVIDAMDGLREALG